MGWFKKTFKKIENSAKKITGLSGHDLGMIALSPFTAGASLGLTSQAKKMIQNPVETLEGGLSGLATGGPMGAMIGALTGSGAFDSNKSSESAASSAVKEQYEYTKKLQEQNQEWQTEMSNTAHQREVTDLQAAGLNPILSAGGNGATTGTPGGGSVGMPDKVAEKTAKMQNKIAMLTLQNEMANSATQRQNIEVDTELKPLLAEAEIAFKGAQAGNAKAQATYTTIMKDIDKKLKRAETIQKVNDMIGAEESEFTIPWIYKHKKKGTGTNSAKQVNKIIDRL